MYNRSIMRLLINLFLTTLMFFFSSSYTYSSIKCGWVTKGEFYKPFVVLNRPSNKVVLFVTSDGRVYKGRCRKKGVNRCTIYPGKRFRTRESVRYIILRLGRSAPEIVGNGVIVGF